MNTPSARSRRLRSLVLALAFLGTLAFCGSAGALDVRPPFVVAVLGDSFASGEGSPDVHGKHSLGGDLVAAECIQLPFTPPPCFAETWWSPDSWFTGRDAIFPQQDDAGWQDAARRCHRSTKAPGPHAAMLIADRFPQVRVEVLDFACGGSQIGPGLLQGWPGPEPPLLAPNLPSQVAALEAYVRGTSRNIDAIVVNIGGNDGRFADLIIHCVLNGLNDCADDQLLIDVGTLTQDPAPPIVPDVAGRLIQRYAAADVALRNSLVEGRPDEVYLTAVPNAVHDAPPVDNPVANPQDLCDGTQTSEFFFSNLKLGESFALDNITRGLNDTMQRAANAHRWIFLPQTSDAFRDHGLCADGASFHRTNGDALRIQGDEGLFLPFLAPLVGTGIISPGIAHPNEAGFADSASKVADVVEEQVRMRFQAPNLTLDFVQANTAFGVTWSDPSPQHTPETHWALEVTGPPGVTQRLLSSSPTQAPLFSSAGTTHFWRVVRPGGEFQVRVQGCRTTPTGAYCGPFSNAITVALRVPGTPLDLRRVGLLRGQGPNAIRLDWDAGPSTTLRTRYEVHFGRFGSGSCLGGPTAPGCTILGQSGVATVLATSSVTTIALPQSGDWLFRIRACSTAGCSAFGTGLTATVPGSALFSPVGTFGLRAPAQARFGRTAILEVAWRTPRRWTDLDRVDLVLRDGRKLIGRVRFLQDDGALFALSGKRSPFGHPDTEGRLEAGPFAVDLARSSVVRFGPAAKRVVLRLGLIPGRSLRGKTITFSLGGKDDRGRTQKEAVAGAMRVR